MPSLSTTSACSSYASTCDLQFHCPSTPNTGACALDRGTCAEPNGSAGRGASQNPEAARSNFEGAHQIAAHLFEPLFNSALLAFKLGDFQQSYDFVSRALERYPDHNESQELTKQLKQHFALL